MNNSKRSIPLQFYVSPEELELIRANMDLIGTDNLSAYLRKMAIDGHIIRLDLPELKDTRSLLRHTSDNFNQIAKRVISTGRIYTEDISDMKKLLDTAACKT